MDSHIAPYRRIWLFLFAIAVMLFLLLPTLVVIPMSFTNSRSLEFPPSDWSLRWYRAFFESREWLASASVSLKTGILSSIFATALGTAAAYSLRVLGDRHMKSISAMLMIPVMVPIVLIAIGVFYVYALLGLLNSLTGLVLAHTTLGIPFVLIIMLARFATYDLNQERVAQSLGATPITAFFLVTFPQIRFAVFSAALLAFLTSFDEVIIAMFVASGDMSTMTRRMFTALRDHVDPSIAAISSMLVFVTLVAVFTLQLLERR